MQTVFLLANDDYGKQQAPLVSAGAFVGSRRRKRRLSSAACRSGGTTTHDTINTRFTFHMSGGIYIIDFFFNDLLLIASALFYKALCVEEISK